MDNLYVYNFYLKPHVALREVKFAFVLIIMNSQIFEQKPKEYYKCTYFAQLLGYTLKTQVKITNLYTAEGLFDLLPDNYTHKIYAYYIQNIA